MRADSRCWHLDGHQQVLCSVHPEVTDLEPQVTDRPLLLLDPPQLRRQLPERQAGRVRSLRQYAAVELPCLADNHGHDLLIAVLERRPRSLVISEQLEAFRGAECVRRAVLLAGFRQLQLILQDGALRYDCVEEMTDLGIRRDV